MSASPDGVRFHQRPGAVADRRDRLLGKHELSDELHRALVHPQRVRVRHPAGQKQSVVLARVDVREPAIHRQHVRLLVVIHPLNGAVLR